MAADRKSRLEISVEDQDKVAVVHLQGEVDLNVSPQLRTRLKELTQTKKPLIVIDMAGVPYIDSSGVATLVECLQGVSRYGGKLRLAAMGRQTLSVLEISRLDTVFSVFDSLEGALRE
jgi:anti-sigma B factor antagonist